ncbi:MAG TPA: DUF1573 domain-containing protein [Candidatus Hydrogenedentes bacterium]|nr:DUF1573 domain-containing protein [Candidatus Hydrogenedentota bacterium]HPC15788.1 DUF1573 domain-containing protein [Candidatus Hydrogenedentota bacterium]HRT19804.1 DUF1573 domain-containing protein [Candidatus Hydrogenedentota bacterium]HRT64577.1 DUF1573 domain-containing protein [Candidatus Hydrogenedentota bacterium]
MRPIAVIAVIAMAGVAGGVVGYGVYKFSAKPQVVVSPAAPTTGKEDQFLQEARKLADATPPVQEAPGALPPVNGDPTEVPIIATDPEETLDFGVIETQGIAVRELKVLNKGKAGLIISQVNTSCGCTKAHIDEDKKNIPPGGSSVITVRVDPKQISGSVSHKTLTILSNDPARNRLTVNVIAKINPEYVLDPEKVEFGEIEKGVMAEKTVILRQTGEETIELLDIRPPLQLAGLEASFVKRPEAEWATPNRPEYAITVRMTPDAPAGPFMGNLSIQTTCKRMPIMQMQIRADVKAFYEVMPPGMRQLLVSAGPKLGQNVAPSPARVTVKSDRPIEIVDLKTSTETLSATSAPGDAPNSFVIEVTASPDAKPARLAETLTFGVKSGDQVFYEKYNVRVLAGRPPVPPPGTGNTPSAGIPGAPGIPAVPQPPQPPPTAAPPPANPGK